MSKLPTVPQALISQLTDKQIQQQAVQVAANKAAAARILASIQMQLDSQVVYVTKAVRSYE